MKTLKEIFTDLKKINFKNSTPIIIAVLTIGVLFALMPGDSKVNEKSITTIGENLMSKPSSNSSKISDYAKLLEDRLENILGEIKGVGKVNVMVTVEETIENIPAKNTTISTEQTTEEDSDGGKREINREDKSEQIVVSNDDMIMIKKVIPEIKGVIVVAQGVEDTLIKEKLYNAVKTVLSLPGHKVEVFISN